MKAINNSLEYLTPPKIIVDRKQREILLDQRATLVWFTGLSGSGKSTLASMLESKLHASSFTTYLLDGDNIRLGLNRDLSFMEGHRTENIRRVAEVSKLFLDGGIIVLSAFISPFRTDRQYVKEMVGRDNFIEVFVDCSLEVCELRDVKGLYRNARAGVLKNFTGIDSPYEPPVDPDIVVRTDQQSIDESCQMILDVVVPRIIL